jgi:hypothetical protein
MSPRRATTESSVDALDVQAPALPKKPRKWADVVKEIRAMREKGANVPEICEQLQVSYVLVNQLILQSYKMAIDTEQVFNRQEEMRLQAEA